MKQVLLAESSQTRRRALAALLAQRGFAVTALSELDEARALLQRIDSSASRCDAVILGWPEYDGESGGEDVFALLHDHRFEHLPVLILADSSSARAVNWRMRRPRTALLLWGDYQEVPDALEQLLQAPGSAPTAEPQPASSLRILLVDDSATVRAAFSRLLNRHGYVVETAGSVDEGLQRVASTAFDIAIVDYFMPERNGTDLIRALRQTPATQHILTAVITGTYSDAVISESLACGAVECLFKSEARELFLARLASLARTVTDRKAVDAERRRLHGILSSVGDGVYGVDGDGIVQFINPAALHLLGYDRADELVGQPAFELFHYAGEDGTPLTRAASFLNQCYANGNPVQGWHGVFWTSTRRPVPIECTVFPMRIDGERTGSVVAFRDVSARRLLEEELRWQAEHDTLTKLHNRAWFETQLAQEIARLKRGDQTSLLLFIDLDRFKYINDTAGHAAGDQLLLEVSQRLRSRLRASDHLARMGGDEYAVILRNVNVDDVATLADGFRRALTTAPFSYGGKSYRITISIGVARLDHATASPDEAMAQADIACHVAKGAGRNQTHLYTPDSRQRATMEMDLGWSARLEEALRENRFVLVYQPIVPLAGIEEDLPDAPMRDLWQRQLERNPDAPAYFEVLLRLRDAQGELVSPYAFLPTAERFAMMGEIDRWVIDNALRALRDARNGPRPVMLSINLSAQSLDNPALADYITARIVEYGVDASMLVFEITESHSINDVVGVQKLLHQLRQLGCRIAVDDFGTGFSTFAYLRQLEADIVKIDGSLIQGLPDDPLDRTVVAALTAIAETAGKRTVAECVEHADALMTLYECGVDFVQGFAVGMPRLQLVPGGPVLVDAATARAAQG